MKEIINPLQPGTLLHGTGGCYKIEKALGQGSFGITYRATVVVEGRFASMETGLRVAVKEFYMYELCGRQPNGTVTGGQDSLLVEDYRRKFAREARNLASLRHPHVIEVKDCFEAFGTEYYVMDYVEGADLSEHLMRRGPLPEAEALSAIRDVAAALDYMHGRRMLHLDLKPANVMRRDADGHIFLIDFGLSKQYMSDGKPHTMTSVGLGTPGYAPVEQADTEDRQRQFAPTLDVYALGATCYKLLTGQTPPKATEVLNNGLPLAPLRERGVSPRTIAAVEAAMQPRRKDRLQTVQAFVDALGGEEETALKPSVPEARQPEATEVRVERPAAKPQAKAQPNRRPVRPAGKPVRPVASPFRPSVPPPSHSAARLGSAPKSRKRTWIVALAVAACVLVGGAWGTYVKFTYPNETVLSDAEQSASRPPEKITVTANGVSFNMIKVEAGTFMMGATAKQQGDADNDEKPAHKVTLTNDYYMGETEVTQELWEAVMGDNPSHHKGNKLPVTEVSWDDCQEFIKKLNQLTGKTFRLPTEAEWEYAARGGRLSKGYKYAGSDDIASVAWYEGNSGEQMHEVAMRQPNELGLYDMSGNIYEWCADWYGDYSGNPSTNPTGASAGSFHVNRGGSWRYLTGSCRVSNRGASTPGYRDRDIGLRVAL